MIADIGPKLKDFDSRVNKLLEELDISE